MGLTLHQIRELDGSHVGHVLAMAPSTFKTLASQFWSDALHCSLIRHEKKATPP